MTLSAKDIPMLTRPRMLTLHSLGAGTMRNKSRHVIGREPKKSLRIREGINRGVFGAV